MQIDKNYVSNYGEPKIKINTDASSGQITTTFSFNKDTSIYYNGTEVTDYQIAFRSSGFYTGYIVNVNVDNAHIKASQSDFVKSIDATTPTSIANAIGILNSDGITLKDANDIIINSHNISGIVSIEGTVLGTPPSGDVQIKITYKVDPYAGNHDSVIALIPKSKFV